ncbi:MAG TPA: putative lipid II flippase FtsW [Burkholderiaceae bacterium]|nr:putative lipid II flippase FtsW [Burkholderiaceae bacterium]
MLSRLRDWMRARRGAPSYAARDHRPGGSLALAGLNAGARPRPLAGLDSYDLPLALVVAALVLLGTVMVYSASITLGDSPRYHVAPTHFLLRHLVALGIAGAGAAVALSVPMAAWERLAPWVFMGALVLLVVVLMVGKGALGARRWIPLGAFNLQPSEVMKIAGVLYAASFTVRKQDYMHHFGKGVLPMAAVIAVIGALLLRQPDFGAFAVIAVICMGILFLGGANARLFAALGGTLVVTLVVMILTADYRIRRVLGFIDVWEGDKPLKETYQLSHSLIAFGRGEWFGVGLGRSVEKLHYLPEAHTDFIFAVIAEELGFVAVLAVIVLFYWLVKRAFEIGRQSIALERTFAGLVAQGIGVWIGVQSFFNMGVATGMLPTKGLTLPFISYGGSALVATITAIGLLMRVDRENRVLMRGGRV